MARRVCVRAAFVGALLLASMPAAAQARLEADAWWGLRTSDGHVSLARATVLPAWQGRPSGSISLDLAARLEFAPDLTGLGTRDTYAPWSRPLQLGDGGRLELDRLTARIDAGTLRLTLGKQVVAWGVLDGVQVTDRFDPVRRRDWVATDVRPQRLGRWTMRAQARLGGLSLDAAFSPDPSVNQQALPGDAFDVRAPRFTAGLEASGMAAAASPRDRALADATWGVRATGTVGRLDASALFFRGPETDPLLVPVPVEAGRMVGLSYPLRSLMGGSLVLPAGATVWRLEVAHIPDQPLNLDAARTGLLAVVRRPRTIAGLGVDWQAPAGLFVNAQLVVDQVSADGTVLARPARDVVGTLRVHRDLAGDRIRLRAEVLADLQRGDLMARPAIEWKTSDRFSMTVGADLFAGDVSGLFGQFGNQTRIWMKAGFAI